MPITLVEALNGSGVIQANANTFATLEYADAYFATRPNSTAWTSADDETQKQALIVAIYPLNILGWIGGLLEETQPLSWPRVAIRPVERMSRQRLRTGYETLTGARGGLYDSLSRFWAATSIPKPIKDAQCEQAIAVLQATVWTTDSVNYKRRIIQNSDGLIEFKSASEQSKLSRLAYQHLGPFLLHGASVSQLARC